jgi:hypothetical protein
MSMLNSPGISPRFDRERVMSQQTPLRPRLEKYIDESSAKHATNMEVFGKPNVLIKSNPI